MKKLLFSIILFVSIYLVNTPIHAQIINTKIANSDNSAGSTTTQQLDYFGQAITRPDGKQDFIFSSAFCTQNEKDQTIAFVLPEQKSFFWVDNAQAKGYFQEGGNSQKCSYLSYVEDRYNRKLQPVSWGIYLAANDMGAFALDLATKPTETTKGFAQGLWRIATLQFDIEKTWQRVLRADATDASYVAASIALVYLSGPKAKGLIAAEDAPKLTETVQELALTTPTTKLTWAQVLENFRKGRAFEVLVTKHLRTLYPTSEGYTVLYQVYLKVDGELSIADNIIYNSRTGKFILNETKCGTSARLSTKQRIIEEAVKAGKELEIRTAEDIIDYSGKIVKRQGQQIKVSQILRSHSMDGTITNNAVKTIWHE